MQDPNKQGIESIPTNRKESKMSNWKKDMTASVEAAGDASKSRRIATELLWSGAKGAITEWDTTQDPGAEGLHADVIGVLGKPRKGDCSKIKTVALATVSVGLDMADFNSLASAYTAAIDLTKGAEKQKREDSHADKVVNAIAGEEGDSPEVAAAKTLLKMGVAKTAKTLLDTLGRSEVDAQRALLRAFTNEMSAAAGEAAKAKADAEPKAPAKPKAEAPAKAPAKPKADKPKADKPKAEAPAKPKADKPKTPVKVSVKPKADKPKAEAPAKPKTLVKPKKVTADA